MPAVLAEAARAATQARATLMAAGGPSTLGAATREGNYMALNGISVSASNGLCKFMKTRSRFYRGVYPCAPDASFLELIYAGFGYDLGNETGYTCALIIIRTEVDYYGIAKSLNTHIYPCI